MTKKDHVALAKALNSRMPEFDSIFYPTWVGCVHTIASALAADNVRFQRERFVSACCQDKKGKDK
jgi:hypothetical protein